MLQPPKSRLKAFENGYVDFDADANSTHENSPSLSSDFADLARTFLDAEEVNERRGSEAADGTAPFQRQAADLKRRAKKPGFVISQ